MFCMPRLKIVSPSLIGVRQMLFQVNVSKCLTYYKGVSEALMKIEQKRNKQTNEKNNQMLLLGVFFLLLCILSKMSLILAQIKSHEIMFEIYFLCYVKNDSFMNFHMLSPCTSFVRRIS